LKLVDVAAIAIDALLNLPRDQQDALIEDASGLHRDTPASPQPAPIST